MNPNNHITSVVEVVAPSAPSHIQIQEEKETQNKHWMEEHPAFQPVNKLRSNGRIISGYDQNGLPVGASVSPFIQEFYTQVESDIAPVVMALKDKGYFTVSSCGGHPLRTLVTLCFPTRVQRAEFAERIKAFDLPTVRFEDADFFFNVNGEVAKNGRRYIESNIDNDLSLDYYRNQEAELLNLMFFRNYEKYVFLTIYLLDDWHPLLHPIRAYRTRKALPSKANIVAKFAEGISSNDFPQNLA